MSTPPYTTLQQLLAALQAEATSLTVKLDQTFLSPRVLDLFKSELGLQTEKVTLTTDSTTKIFIANDAGGTPTLYIENAIAPADASLAYLNLRATPVNVAIQQTTAGSGTGYDLVIATTLPLGWLFSDSFPRLGGLMDSEWLATPNGQYLYFSSFTTNQPVPVFPNETAPDAPTGAILATGLTWFADLGLSGVFGLAETILGLGTPTLPVHGPITDPTSTEPMLDLRATATTKPLQVGFLELTVPWIGIRTSYVSGADATLPSDTTTYPRLAFYIGTIVGVQPQSGNDPLEVEIDLNFTDPGSTNVLLTVGAPPGKQLSLGSVAQLLLNTDAQTMQQAVGPTLENNLNDIQLVQFSAMFIPSAKTPLQYVSASLATKPPWQLGISSGGNEWTLDLTLKWTTYFFLPNTTWNAVFDAILTVSPTLSFEVSVTVPQLSIVGTEHGSVTLALSDLNAILPSSLSIPSDLLSMTLTNFTVAVDFPTKNWSIAGEVSAEFALFGTPILSLQNMQVSFDHTSTGYTATLDGIIALGTIQLQTTATISDQAGVDTVFTMHLVNETVGSMLNHLVHLVDPTFDISLSEPWDKLLDISLDAFVVQITLPSDSKKGSTVSLSYSTSIDLGFIDIKAISLTYTKPSTAASSKPPTTASSVQIELEGTFLGQSFGGSSDNPKLGWDAMNENPPSVPGKGEQLFDLQYVGLGQHIAFKGEQPATIADVMKKLHESVTPAQAGQLPDFGADGNLAFSKNSNWLIGAQFTVMDTVAISAIFNDPNLYGILIQLSGAKAKIFAGLSFEILYRKITDTIGVYHIELKLPDAMRNLQFGEVSITLPVIILDVYTNGNFRVDLGFPTGLDFSNSFAIQVFPFVGYGGFYFALLDGATSTRVPQITNGTFSPVIEFGVALSLGVGKTIDEGILSGGITVTVIGILQGVLGWFNPTQPAAKEEYYWFQGSISIVGKLYATINFAIISASLDVTAYATVTLTIESHQPIYIQLDAGVSVTLSVKVLFFTIHLSFSATVHASFTIGSATPTPWILADGGGASSGSNAQALPSPVARSARALAATAPAVLGDGIGSSGSNGALRQLRGQQTLHSTVVRHAGFVRALRSARIAAVLAETPPLTNWPAVLVLPQIETLALRLLPSFTKSEAAGVDAALLLTAENSIDPGAVTLSDHRALYGAAPETAAFNLLMEAMLLWAIQAQTGGQAQVSADDLESLQQQLKDPDTVAAAFDYTTLTSFLAANFVFDVTTVSQWTITTAARANNVVTLTTATSPGLAVGDTVNVAGVTDASFDGQFQLTSASDTTLVYAQEGPDAQSTGGTVDETGGVTFFPMVPAVKLSDSAGLSVDFSNFNLVDANYQAKAAAYFQLLQTQFQQRTGGQGNDDELTASAPVSVATVIFAHYFNMLMTAGIKAAIDLLHSYAYTTPSAQSIGDIAGEFDNTLLSEPLRIVAPNQDEPVLAQGAMFNLPNVVVQVRSGDSPASLAQALAAHGALNAGNQPYTENDLFAANASAAGIFTAGLALTFNGLTYSTQTNDTLNMIAARLLLHLASPSVISSVVGLTPAVQLLLQQNPGITDPNRPLAALIAPQNGAVRKNGLTTITTLTPHGLANGATVNIQGVGDASFNANNVSVVTVLTELSFTYQQTGLPDGSSGNGVAAYPQPIVIPNSNSYTVAPGDTVTLIAVYSLAFAQGLLNVAAFVDQLQQLNSGLPTDPTQPLPVGTVIKFPPVIRALAAGDSINSLATALLTTPDFIQTNLAAVPASTQLLAPQSVLHVPLQYAATAKTGTNAGDTFSGIASKFDLTLQEVATQAVNVTGLFAAQQSLTITDLPQIAVPTLVAGLLNQSEWNNAAGQVSRFLLSGLRLPDPNDPYFQGLTLADMSNPTKVGPIKTLPLYQLTGQQYTLPATLDAYQITLADQAQVPWLQFNGSGSATLGLTADQQELITKIANSPITPNVQTLTRLALYQMTPPRIALQNHIAWQAGTLPGGCLSSGGAAGNPSLWLFPDSLVQQIEQAGGPNTSLLYELVAAKHHDPGQPVTAAEVNCYAWATVVDFEIALPATGQPTPSVANAYVVNGADDTGAALLQEVQQYLTANPRTLGIAANGAVRTGGATPVTTITTATAHGLAPGSQVTISGVQDASFNGAFTVDSVPSPTTFTYAQPGQTAATSTGGSVSAPALAELYLLYSPNPSSSNPSGLVSDQINADASYLLKTNLSTLTHSGGGNFEAFATTDPTGIYAARLSDPADFVALLWEASITRSGGFYLSYFNQGNAGLPSSVFGTNSTATLSLLVLLDAQAGSKDATTLPFNNCAIVGDNIDTSTTTLFVQPAIYTVVSGDSLTSATSNFNQVWATNYSVIDVAGFNQDVPLLLQVGATLTIPNQGQYPIEYGDTLASIVKKQLPSGSLQDLINAGANATSPILAAGAAMQFAQGILQPAATVPQGTLGFEVTRTAPDPTADVVDTLFNLVGYSIEAAGPFLQSGEGLPTTPADSWQAQTDGLTQRALDDEVSTEWYYHQTLVVNPFATQPQGSTSAALPVPQNNPYNGIGALNQLANQLNDVTLKLQLQDIFGNSPAAAALQTLPVPVGYFDTLNSLASWPSLAVSYEVSGENGAPQIALDMTMQQVRYIPSASIPVAAAQAAVSADLASYQSIYYQMGQPDVTFALQTSLDTKTASYPLDKTPFFAFAYGAYIYLSALASMQQVTPTLSGATVSTLWDQYGVTAGQIFEANQNTLVTKLFADTALAVPQMYASVQSDSLQSIVNDPQWQSFALTVEGLATLNQNVPLGPGVDLATPAARTVQANANDSLNSVAQSAHASVAALALVNSTTPGLWRQGAVLTVGTKQYTMGANEQLADAAKALNVTVEALALANQWLTNLFADSVTLQVNDILIRSGDTLASLATLVSTTVATLATTNAPVANLFAPATEIQIGLESQPAPPGATDTLASYAASNHVSLAQLGQANVGTAFLDGAQPLIPGALQQTTAPQFCTYVASGTDTPDSIAAKFGTTAATLSALNQGLPDLLNGNAVVPGGRWICPPMQGDAHGNNSQQTLAGLAAAYNILAYNIVTSESQPDVATLAQANAASLGLLAANVPLPQWPLLPVDHTIENETFNSLVNRLAAANILKSDNSAYTVSDVALALADTPNLINPQAVVTPVPPVALNSNAVKITPNFVQEVFPLVVNVITTRNQQWVDPDFTNVASVFQAVTSIRPEPDQTQDDDTNTPFTFNKFATDLQTALGGLFVATGAPPAEGDSQNASTFWAVNLGNAAGPQLTYQFEGAATEYFSLPPLSTSLESGTVNIMPYVSGQVPPFTGPKQAQNFKAVDMDVWLETFLQSIDLFLSPAYVVPAYAINPDTVTGVIEDKKTLAQKLAQLVTWVLQAPQKTSLDDAQAAMHQALLMQLSNAFTVDTLVQVPVTVTSSTNKATVAPRLSGKLGLEASQTIATVARSGNEVTLTTATPHGLSAGDTVNVAGVTDESFDGQFVLTTASGTTLVYAQEGPDAQSSGGTVSQQLPNAFSFSTAKVALTNGSSTATFLFSVKAPASSKDAALDLQYNVTELELPDPKAVIGDYEGSSWLKFIQPLPVEIGTSSSVIGNVDIPIPLRSYPSPLVLVSQTATPSFKAPANTDELVQWDATTTWQHQDADQDDIALRMEVATADPGALNRTLSADDTDPLFAALAQFIAVWPAVSNDLARLTTLAPGAPLDPIATGALAAFATMVDTVTTVWPSGQLAPSTKSPATDVLTEILPGTYDYTLIRQVDSNSDLSTLTVKADAANPATLWPEFSVAIGPEDKPRPLTRILPSTASQAIYTYPPGVPNGLSLRYSLTLPNLDIVMIPDFELSVSVTRNADLITSPPSTTSPQFIYRTPYTGFPSPLIPLLVFGEDFPIGTGSTAQLEAALVAFLEGLLDRQTTSGTTRTLRVAGSYGYDVTQGVTAGAATPVSGAKSSLTAGSAGLVPTLPIVLVPSVELVINGDNNASIAAFAKNLADFIVQWDGQVNPSHANASLFFDVCLFSANAASDTRPLLIVSSVQYSLE